MAEAPPPPPPRRQPSRLSGAAGVNFNEESSDGEFEAMIQSHDLKASLESDASTNNHTDEDSSSDSEHQVDHDDNNSHDSDGSVSVDSNESRLSPVVDGDNSDVDGDDVASNGDDAVYEGEEEPPQAVEVINVNDTSDDDDDLAAAANRAAAAANDGEESSASSSSASSSSDSSDDEEPQPFPHEKRQEYLRNYDEVLHHYRLKYIHWCTVGQLATKAVDFIRSAEAVAFRDPEVQQLINEHHAQHGQQSFHKQELNELCCIMDYLIKQKCIIHSIIRRLEAGDPRIRVFARETNPDFGRRVMDVYVFIPAELRYQICQGAACRWFSE